MYFIETRPIIIFDTKGYIGSYRFKGLPTPSDSSSSSVSKKSTESFEAAMLALKLTLGVGVT